MFIAAVTIADVDSDYQKEIVTGGHFWDGTHCWAQLVVWDGATLAVEDVQFWYWVGSTAICSIVVDNVDSDQSVEIVTGGYYNDGTRLEAQLVVSSS